MKKKELKKLRDKNIASLDKTLSEKKKELLQVKIQIGMGQEKNVKKAKNIKRDIAQIKTIIRQKEIIKDTKTKETKNDDKKKGDEKNKG